MIVHFDRDDARFPAVWEHLARVLQREGQTTDYADEHPDNGERWQYMGTASEWTYLTHYEDGRPLRWELLTPAGQGRLTFCGWNHQFRHRDYHGQRRYVNVLALPDTLPTAEETLAAARREQEMATFPRFV